MNGARAKEATVTRTIETVRDTAKRHSQNYVTERERRYLREIEKRQADGILVTPAQLDYAASIRAVLARRGEQ